MIIPLEDTYEDVIGKAQRGLGLPAADQLSVAEQAARLHLNPAALLELKEKSWTPPRLEVTRLVQFNAPYGDMTVNHYLAFDAVYNLAMAFDTGPNVQPLIKFLTAQGLKLAAIFLTHTHGDHVLELDLLQEKTGAPAYVCEREPFEGAESFAPGREFSVGSLRVETRLTCGHSVGGITYVVHGLEKGVAVVGDALFASSMGGGMVSYADALRTNLAEIYTLPEETVLCPGHGPLTTVGIEKEHNPFYRG